MRREIIQRMQKGQKKEKKVKEDDIQDQGTPIKKKVPPAPPDPKVPKTIIDETARRVFGFKCEVRDGSLAERETERRIRVCYAVLEDAKIKIWKDARTLTSDEKEDLVFALCAYLKPIYAMAEKELSTENILNDVFAYFKAEGYSLRFTSS